MRIQTFTLVAGSEACNARCPYCVSRMTPDYQLGTTLPAVNWRNFRIGCRFAKDSGVSTALITGKGEPTLFPDRITEFLDELSPFRFPFTELQTNGICLAEGRRVTEDRLRDWYERGLSMVALSIVHWLPERNGEIFRPGSGAEYHDLADLVARLHALGFSVRLSCSMLKGYVDRAAAVDEMVAFSREHGVEQLTIRPISQPASSADREVSDFVTASAVSPETVREIRDHLDARGARLMELVHGAIVYDCGGQNVCLSNCLTIEPGDERIRQIIFFPDGHLRYDWQYAGAVLL